MKNPRRWVIFILLLAVLSVCCGCGADGSKNQPSTESSPELVHYGDLTVFLTEVNHSGQIGSADEAVVPGTLPSVELIPAADQSMVGQTVMILLSTDGPAFPFYYIRSAAGAERLAVIVEAKSIPLLIIFQTQLGGATGLYSKIASGSEFQATILSMTNISREEGSVYAYNAASSDNIPAEEYLDRNTPAALFAAGEYIGIVGLGHDGASLCIMKGGAAESHSEKLQQNIDVFLRIFQRFSLTETLGIS